MSRHVLTYLYIILLSASPSVRARTLFYVLMCPQNLTRSLAHGRRSINKHWWRKEWMNAYLGKQEEKYISGLCFCFTWLFNRVRTFQIDVSVAGMEPPRRNFQGAQAKTCPSGVPGSIPLPSDLPTTLAVPFFFLHWRLPHRPFKYRWTHNWPLQALVSSLIHCTFLPFQLRTMSPNSCFLTF